MDLVGIGKELGPNVRFMGDVVRMNSTAFGPDLPEAEERKRNLAKVVTHLNLKYGHGWLDEPSTALKDPMVNLPSVLC